MTDMHAGSSNTRTICAIMMTTRSCRLAVYCDDFVKGDDGAWRIQKLRMAYREMDGSFRSTMVPKDWVPDEWDTPNY